MVLRTPESNKINSNLKPRRVQSVENVQKIQVKKEIKKVHFEKRVEPVQPKEYLKETFSAGDKLAVPSESENRKSLPTANHSEIARNVRISRNGLALKDAMELRTARAILNRRSPKVEPVEGSKRFPDRKGSFANGRATILNTNQGEASEIDGIVVQKSTSASGAFRRPDDELVQRLRTSKSLKVTTKDGSPGREMSQTSSRHDRLIELDKVDATESLSMVATQQQKGVKKLIVISEPAIDQLCPNREAVPRRDSPAGDDPTTKKTLAKFSCEPRTRRTMDPDLSSKATAEHRLLGNMSRGNQKGIMEGDKRGLDPVQIRSGSITMRRFRDEAVQPRGPAKPTDKTSKKTHKELSEESSLFTDIRSSPASTPDHTRKMAFAKPDKPLDKQGKFAQHPDLDRLRKQQQQQPAHQLLTDAHGKVNRGLDSSFKPTGHASLRQTQPKSPMQPFKQGARAALARKGMQKPTISDWNYDRMSRGQPSSEGQLVTPGNSIRFNAHETKFPTRPGFRSKIRPTPLIKPFHMTPINATPLTHRWAHHNHQPKAVRIPPAAYPISSRHPIRPMQHRQHFMSNPSQRPQQVHQARYDNLPEHISNHGHRTPVSSYPSIREGHITPHHPLPSALVKVRPKVASDQRCVSNAYPAYCNIKGPLDHLSDKNRHNNSEAHRANGHDHKIDVHPKPDRASAMLSGIKYEEYQEHSDGDAQMVPVQADLDAFDHRSIDHFHSEQPVNEHKMDERCMSIDEGFEQDSFLEEHHESSNTDLPVNHDTAGHNDLASSEYNSSTLQDDIDDLGTTGILGRSRNDLRSEDDSSFLRQGPDDDEIEGRNALFQSYEDEGFADNDHFAPSTYDEEHDHDSTKVDPIEKETIDEYDSYDRSDIEDLLADNKSSDSHDRYESHAIFMDSGTDDQSDADDNSVRGFSDADDKTLLGVHLEDEDNDYDVEGLQCDNHELADNSSDEFPDSYGDHDHLETDPQYRDDFGIQDEEGDEYALHDHDYYDNGNADYDEDAFDFQQDYSYQDREFVVHEDEIENDDDDHTDHEERISEVQEGDSLEEPDDEVYKHETPDHEPYFSENSNDDGRYEDSLSDVQQDDNFADRDGDFFEHSTFDDDDYSANNDTVINDTFSYEDDLSHEADYDVNESDGSLVGDHEETGYATGDVYGSCSHDDYGGNVNDSDGQDGYGAYINNGDGQDVINFEDEPYAADADF